VDAKEMYLRRKCGKIQYKKITTQGGVWVSLLIVTTRNVKCRYLCVVLFWRIKIFFFTAKYEAKL